MTLKTAGARKGQFQGHEHNPDKVHALRSSRPLILALEIGVRQAEARRDFNAQHGKVRILMVNGQPGPDAEVSKCI